MIARRLIVIRKAGATRSIGVARSRFSQMLARYAAASHAALRRGDQATILSRLPLRRFVKMPFLRALASVSVMVSIARKRHRYVISIGDHSSTTGLPVASPILQRCRENVGRQANAVRTGTGRWFSAFVVSVPVPELIEHLVPVLYPVRVKSKNGDLTHLSLVCTDGLTTNAIEEPFVAIRFLLCCLWHVLLLIKCISTCGFCGRD